MSANNYKHEKPCNIDIVRLSYLTDDERNVVEIIKKGEPIIGSEKTIDGINAWIDICLKNRTICN